MRRKSRSKTQTFTVVEDPANIVICNYSTRRRLMQYLVFFLAILILCSSCTAQIITDPPDPLSVEENQADIILFTGTYTWQDVSCTMKEADGTANIPDLRIDVTHVAVQGSCDFNVTLVTPVDYEKFVQTITKFIAVVNLMDTAPAFPNSVYTASIPENHVVNTPVLVNIRADDADGTDSITYTVNFVDQQKKVFEDRRQANPEILDIYLISSLDFEQQHTYRFTITAVDSVGMNSTCDVIIKVINIQDTPPYFTALQYNGRVAEDVALGTSVLSVSAVDGDSVLLQGEWSGTTANQMYYSIIDGGDGMFAVNSSNGDITTITPLDIDNNTNVRNGLVVLNIMAEELNTSMEPQYGDSSSTVLVMIQIEDANDNRPQFSSQAFTGSIGVNAFVGEFITLESGGYISVHDLDQAPSNNRFCLHIERDAQRWDVFKPNIESQYAYASVMIQLNKNDSLTDLAETHIRFQIVAEECGNLFQIYPPTKSDITVWVKGQTAPTSSPGPIIDLPLSTSDIIVFIVGLLLLLNIGLTVFICYALRGGRGYPLTLGNRNSKYRMANSEYSSEPYNKTNDVEFMNPGTSKCVANDNMAKTNAISTQEQANLRNAQINADSVFVNAPHPDMTILKDRTEMLSLDVNKEVFTKNTHAKNNASFKPSTNDVLASQMKPEETVILNDRSHINQIVTSPKLASAEVDNPLFSGNTTQQHNKPGTEMFSLEQDLSRFLQDSQQHLGEVHDYGVSKEGETCDLQDQQRAYESESDLSVITRIRSSNSSFSENRSSDELPLIKFPHVKAENNYKAVQNTAISLSDTNGKIKQPMKKNTSTSFLLDQSHTDNPIQKSDKEKKLALSSTKNKNVDQTILPIPDKDNADLKTSSAMYQSSITAQLTQTGVPPIALALPYSTGTFSINKELQTGIVNPVFGTQAIISGIPQDTGETVLRKNGYSTGAGVKNKKNESSLSDETPLNPNGSKSQLSDVQLENPTNNTTEQLNNTQNEESPPSPLNTHIPRDYMTAAKELLSTKIKSNKSNPEPQLKQVIHDNTAEKTNFD